MKVRGSECSRQRCKRRAYVAGMCKTHATDEADRLFSLAVRSVGECQIRDGRPCNGNLQCMHLLTRSLRVIRWDRRNALCGCAGHHTYYTHNPHDWVFWLFQRFGEEYVLQLRRDALTHQPPNLADVLAELKAAA
jgi:hypothetical protein